MVVLIDKYLSFHEKTEDRNIDFITILFKAGANLKIDHDFIVKMLELCSTSLHFFKLNDFILHDQLNKEDKKDFDTKYKAKKKLLNGTCC